MKELLFSLTKKDFIFQPFKSGGPGGMNKNKVSSAIRCIHRESGAVGEGKELRDQPQNKRNAFIRCVNSSKFQSWLKIEISRKNGDYDRAVKKVEKMMDEANLKIEYF